MGKINMVRLIALLAICALPWLSFGEMTEEKDVYRLSAKGFEWWIQFPKSDYKLENERHRPDGKADYYMFSSDGSELNVSFYIEPAVKCTSSTECRDMYWKNPGPLVQHPQRVRQYEKNGSSIVEFYLPSVQDVPVRQMNISGHIVRDGYWVDMHISKVLFKEADQEIFDRFINSISFPRK